MTDRKGMITVVAFLPVLVAVLVVTSALRAGLLSSFAWFGYFTGLVSSSSTATPATTNGAGSPIVRSCSRPRKGRVVVRPGVVAGLALSRRWLVLLDPRSIQRGRPGALGAVAMLIAAIVLVFGPWWFRLTRDLVSERQARVKARCAPIWRHGCTTRCCRPWR